MIRLATLAAVPGVVVLVAILVGSFFYATKFANEYRKRQEAETLFRQESKKFVKMARAVIEKWPEDKSLFQIRFKALADQYERLATIAEQEPSLQNKKSHHQQICLSLFDVDLYALVDSKWMSAEARIAINRTIDLLTKLEKSLVP